MAENLAYKASSGCWTYDNSESIITTHGYLYKWKTAKNVCPSDWHLPSDAEWTTLTDYLGGKDLAGGKLKSTTGWETPNNGATNSSSFTALPGGYRDSNEEFSNITYYGYWWSSTEYYTFYARYLNLYFGNSNVLINYLNKSNGFSVRCVRDK
jgi:uncharacterized protein (TIGR02145 family)